MLAAIPLMIIPLIFYNMVIFGPFDGSGVAMLSMEMFTIAMVSGATWSMQLGDLVIATALVFLFLEVIKATRTSGWSVIDHLLSALVFIVFLVEFLLVRGAATNIFFILTVVAFVDLIAGFSVSIKSAGRDVSIGL